MSGKMSVSHVESPQGPIDKMSSCIMCDLPVLLLGTDNLVDQRSKMVRALCAYLKMELKDVPVEFTQEMFPVCKLCEQELFTVWDNITIVQNAQQVISKCISSIERTVADSELLRKTTITAIPSTMVGREKRFIQLREVMLNGFANKLLIKQKQRVELALVTTRQINQPDIRSTVVRQYGVHNGSLQEKGTPSDVAVSTSSSDGPLEDFGEQSRMEKTDPGDTDNSYPSNSLLQHYSQQHPLIQPAQLVGVEEAPVGTTSSRPVADGEQRKGSLNNGMESERVGRSLGKPTPKLNRAFADFQLTRKSTKKQYTCNICSEVFEDKKLLFHHKTHSCSSPVSYNTRSRTRACSTLSNEKLLHVPIIAGKRDARQSWEIKSNAATMNACGGIAVDFAVSNMEEESTLEQQELQTSNLEIANVYEQNETQYHLGIKEEKDDDDEKAMCVLGF